MLLDTLKYVKMMKAVGFNQDQSETVVGLWSGIVKEQFVTKQDLSEALLKERMITNKQFETVDKKLAGLDARFDHIDIRFQLMEKKLTIRLGLMQVGSVGLLFSLIKLSKYFENLF